MKKIKPLFLVSILVLTLVTGIFIPMFIEAARDPLPSPIATGHIYFDIIDSVWRCAGSPINCGFMH